MGLGNISERIRLRSVSGGEEAWDNVADLSFRRSELTNQKLESECTSTERRNKTENLLFSTYSSFFNSLPVKFPQRLHILRTIFARKEGMIHADCFKDFTIDS
jgi:hypothetical protein